ncbi:uncharacterized protein LOC108595958 [Drosophila busckii]|uniref:uncharacterized protein LOC108595958 n=1 Tax=Drosophila busckii TaxID=30019 RepID=UPI00083EDC1A|nr:uncharacterized protein LOC108595958 [Drosophila busckii]
MLGFIIALSCAFTIFVLTSIVVMYRRRQKEAANVGYVINPSPAPPQSYQPNHQIFNPAQAYNGQQQPHTWQPPIHAAPVANAEPSVLPDTLRQQTTAQTHVGAVETISQA